ncbi:hypothetical protein C7Y47_01270 [Lysinibacillus sphaericus]|uniref:Beta-lactamase n=1 Tax=Lysinibacillus sphaericus TaxID=1421 RepID=A0A544V0V0_LYSSH|nr:serine hydrolase domain-containing protein [Lysinibacillus sp. SDF0037]TQR39690.1 hypothetical protein C7Y47_01270 [Lysinibacillus sp. SDF0037]
MKKIMLFMFGLSLFNFQNSQIFGQSESAFASELSDEIADIVNDEMKRSNIPGVFVTVVSEDGVIYQNGFGYSDKSQHSRVDEKTLFELGSVSKSFTGLALLKLEAEEKVRLTEPVSTYLPNISFIYNGESAIVTIADFLSHRSGLPFNTIATIPETDSENALIQTVENLNNIALAHPPGEKYEYATINYDVLGLVIQKVTGVSYEEYVRTNIFEPLSLNETFIGVTNGQTADKSKGYKLAFGQAKEFSSPVFAGNNPAGYIISSGNDLAKWLTFQLGLSNTDYLDSSIIASSHQINGSDKDGFNYAAGWFVYDQGQRIYHGGNNPNFSAFVQFYPEEGIGIGVLTNLNTLGTDNIGFRISDLLTGDTTFQGGSDENQLIDFYATIIFWVLVLLNSFLLIKVIMIAREIKKGQRTLKEIISWPQIIGKSTLSLMIIGLLVYCFHQVPYVFLGGLNWSFLFVWLPYTIKAVYFGSLLLILLLFVYLSMLLQFPKKNIELSPLLILSIISGLGNAFVILVINTAIGANEKASLIPFFFLGITLYIYTQQLVRSKVIEVSNEIIFKKRIEIIQKILKTPYEDFESMNRGTIQATLNNDTEAISNSINALVILGGLINNLRIDPITSVIINPVVIPYQLLFSLFYQVSNPYIHTS